MNRYSLWKYLLIIAVISLSIILALPNIYGKNPALQITSSRSAELSEITEIQIEAALDKNGIKHEGFELSKNSLTVRFEDEETQLKAQLVIKQELGREYIVAINLAPATPDWLRKLGLEPMFLGLDLRGGVHFLMEVEMDAALIKAYDHYADDLRSYLRDNKVRYKTITKNRNGGLLIRFRDVGERDKGVSIIEDNLIDLELSIPSASEANIELVIKDKVVVETKKLALQQNITTLRKRVNELGVAEPVIQQQGTSRVVVQLPGVQDTAEAKKILGATATLEFRLVDEDHDPRSAIDGNVPAGSKLYYERNGAPILLKKQVMLTGDSIINAASGIDQVSGGPDVTITLDGVGAKRMSHGTRDNIGKRLAVVFIENKIETVERNGKLVEEKRVIEDVISAATIREQLGKRFHITGLDSIEEAKTLSLLLRAGALAAPIYIVEERTVGPSLGQENIDKGINSVIIGFILVIIFITIYYRVFGVVAVFALVLNVIFILAMLSLLQATLTLPGIAGIVLTMGMAVDANVLIFERIREEIRNGNSPQASIYAGYQKAFSTIADSNITTLIAALVLFGFGTGPIKGFAVTLSLGIISSMFTAIIVSRALVNLIYGGRRLNKLSI